MLSCGVSEKKGDRWKMIGLDANGGSCSQGQRSMSCHCFFFSFLFFFSLLWCLIY